MTSAKRATYFLLVFLVFLNHAMFVQPKPHAEERREDQELTGSTFSWDIATDNPAVYELIPAMLDLEKMVDDFVKAESNMTGASPSHTHTRRKRYPRSYASNYRKPVSKRVQAMDAQSKPFSAAVRVSNECSGTLISDSHVLTAAHCVHTGKRSKYKLHSLKVGFLRRNGHFHWKSVRKIFVPDAWKKSGGKRDSTGADSDFAILTLKHPHHRSSYFMPRRSYLKEGAPMMFNGFPRDKGGNTMWHSSCHVHTRLRNLSLSTCRASQGTSGAGVYRARQPNNVIGVVCAAIKISKGRHKFLFTLTNHLTPKKVKMICRWTGRRAC